MYEDCVKDDAGAATSPHERGEPPVASQQGERRGTMVYGEDFGPGTAEFVADYPTMIEAQRVRRFT